MTRYLYKGRAALMAGVATLGAWAGMAVFAAPAGATVSCPPGTTNPAYCTDVPEKVSGHTVKLTLPPGAKSLAIPVTIAGQKLTIIYTKSKSGKVTISFKTRPKPGTYVIKVTQIVKGKTKVVTYKITVKKPKPKKK